MNLVPGRLQAGQVMLPCAVPLAWAQAADGPCRIGIRPESKAHRLDVLRRQPLPGRRHVFGADGQRLASDTRA